jgi:hypothetical protein
MLLSDSLRVEPGRPADLAGRDPRATLRLGDKESTRGGTGGGRPGDRSPSGRPLRGGCAIAAGHPAGHGYERQGRHDPDVFNATGPLGVHVTSFKQPSEEERQHDYLWRVHKACPPRGTIGIFNRSHYEDVLVVKVAALRLPIRSSSATTRSTLSRRCWSRTVPPS